MIDRKRRALCGALWASAAPWPLALAAGRQRPSASPSVADESPRTVVDDRGHPLTLTRTPRRLATLSYFGADTALALGTRPVASTFLMRGRPPGYLLGRMDGVRDLGQRASPNLELLAAARCDLIVAMRRYTEANAAQLERIAPYLAFDLETFADSDPSIARVGTALGQPARARQLNARFARVMAGYRQRVPARRNPPRYLFIWGAGTAPWAFYDENMTCSLLNLLGGANVAGPNPLPARRDNTAFQMSLEAMLLADPDLIFIYDDGPAGAFETNPIWPHLAAVRNARVIRVGDHWIESFGPIARHVVVAEAASLLHPGVFESADPRAIARSYLA